MGGKMWDEENLPTVLRKKLPLNLEKIRHGHYTKDDLDYPVNKYLEENDLRVDETGSEVVEFLKGKSILITGATGFLGKLLVEKLLRCCRDIEKIYILVRTKKGKDIDSRIKEYLHNWVFVRLSEIHPNFREKIVGISGDFEEDGLGISDESRKILTQKVNIIYHAAATVRFDEQLKKAVKINIRGTQEVIKLAKECVKLDVLTHISSAYSNCIHKEITEEFYPPVIDPQVIIDITEKLSNDLVDRLTPGLLGDYPNTYAFTKHIAEHMIRTESVGLATCIQRPSIVIGSVREPIKSWADNIFGPVGLSLAVAIGLLHVMLGNPGGKCDMVPVDYVINNCIAASYKTAKERLKMAYDKIHKFMGVLSYFTLSEWSFQSTNTKNLWNSLNDNDKKIFFFDMSTLDWRVYFETYYLALREFLLLDFLDTVDQGRAHYKRLTIIHYIFTAAILVLPTYYWINTVFCFIPISIIIITLFFIHGHFTNYVEYKYL